ncbi:MAG: tetratricopeptide repeat protein [Candidatus Korobacteraceae bacterium]
MTSVDLKPAQQSHSAIVGRFASPLTQKIFLGFVLAVAVVAVYYPVHWQPFANYDDADYVTDNFHVKAGLHWETIKWALTARDAANWHPVTWISHALDTQTFGLDPAGPHDVNVLLHTLNALLLFWVLQQATGFIGRSWMVAALFALHPVNVETVAWIAERKNLLSMFFFLLTLAAYRWYACKPRMTRYLIVAALFALGLMSKPQVITLPFVLLLWDYWPLGRLALRSSPSALRQNNSGEISGEKRKAKSEWRWLLLEKVPLLALCVGSAVFTLNAQAGGGATSYYGHVLRLQNALVSYARYLGKAFWPSGLALFYPYPLKPYPVWQVGGAAVILLAITAGVVLAYRRRYLTVGWLWFLGTLVPMIGVVQVGTQAMADRYAYLPFVGLFIMVCWRVADWAWQVHLPPVLLRTASVVVLLALALVSHRQVSFWNDHITLWTHVLEVTNDNWVAENNLGTALLKMGRMEDAIPHFRAAVALDPTDPNSTLNIGTYEQSHGNLPAAIELYGKAAGMARNPKVKARAYNNLGYAYKDIGDLADARTSFQRAVAVDPEFVGAWISLGLVAQRMGDLPLAVSSYSSAMQINSSDYGYLLLAGALEASGDRAQAAGARQKAVLLSNNIGAAQRHADKLLAH